MEIERILSRHSDGHGYRLVIPYKFPSLNDYVKANRTNKFMGAKMKRDVQNDIGYFLMMLPKFERPIFITFTWTEGNRKRDPDNIAFAKKFILDGLIETEKIENDTFQWIKGFTDYFEQGDEFRVVMDIKEV